MRPLLPFDDERVAERVDLDLGGIDAGQLDLEHVVVAVRAQIGDEADRAAGSGRALRLEQLTDDLLRFAAEEDHALDIAGSDRPWQGVEPTDCSRKSQR